VADASGADPWGPKAARASAGALVRLPVARGGDAPSLIEAARSIGRHVVAAVAHGGDSPRSLSGGTRKVLLLGSEGRGLRPEHAALADAQVTIPLAPGVDSLGVAAAAAILLYELQAPTTD
jgi:TrmH family RNA methyltransferase